MSHAHPDAEFLAALLDSLKEPFLFADNEHIIRYMNRAAKTYFTLGEKLLGCSLLDCHNPRSCRQILEIFEKMKSGLEEELITDNERHRVYMRSVRDASGTLLGYYERYQVPRQPGEEAP
ncbi:MAG: PAS domain-containing protein [Deltaproteobacteria bacterium]|nr:PAS domain-containing protein [Deltaproteobacteria bacterium]